MAADGAEESVKELKRLLALCFDTLEKAGERMAELETAVARAKEPTAEPSKATNGRGAKRAVIEVDSDPDDDLPLAAAPSQAKRNKATKRKAKASGSGARERAGGADGFGTTGTRNPTHGSGKADRGGPSRTPASMNGVAGPADLAFPPGTLVDYKQGTDPSWPCIVVHCDFTPLNPDPSNYDFQPRTRYDIQVLYLGPGAVAEGVLGPYFARAQLFENPEKSGKVSRAKSAVVLSDRRIAFYRDCIADPKTHFVPKHYKVTTPFSRRSREDLMLAIKEATTLSELNGEAAKSWWAAKASNWTPEVRASILRGL